MGGASLARQEEECEFRFRNVGFGVTFGCQGDETTAGGVTVNTQ